MWNKKEYLKIVKHSWVPVKFKVCLMFKPDGSNLDWLTQYNGKTYREVIQKIKQKYFIKEFIFDNLRNSRDSEMRFEFREK